MDDQFFRWILLAVLAGNLAMSAFFRRRARQESGTIPRAAEGGPLVLLRLAVTLPLVLSLAAYLLNPRWMEWSAVELATPWRWLGAALGVATMAWMHWVLRSLGRNISETTLTKERHELVTHGPYRWIRHPLYTGGLTLLASFSLLTANLLIAVGTVLGLAVILAVVIPREEEALIEKFGDRYRGYRQRTGRLLPRIF